MSKSEFWAYHVAVEGRGRSYRGRCDALPEAVAVGSSRAEVLAAMRDVLATAVRGRMRRGEPLEPQPDPEGDPDAVALPFSLQAKAGVYSLWKRSGITKTELARRSGLHETEVRRVLNPDVGTSIERLELVAGLLGSGLTVGWSDRTGG